jgi:hypothetical protein
MMGGRIYAIHERTHCVPTICDDATLTRNVQWLNIKPIGILNNAAQFTSCQSEQMKTHI